MNNNIIFSIILPTYNRVKTISKSIDSVLEQNYSKWELIIIDDGSNDNTDIVCKKYIEKNSNISYYKFSNSGVSNSRNIGLHKAIGNYIVFLDSDDVLKCDMLKKLYDRIILFGEPEMLCFGFENSNISWVPHYTEADKSIKKELVRNLYLKTHLSIVNQDSNFLQHYVWNKCFKRDILKENCIKFDTNKKTWEDGLFVIQCLNKVNTLILINEVLYYQNCSKDLNHLSSKIYHNQLQNYIDDEKYYLLNFGNEFDFFTDVYFEKNFRILKYLISNTIKEFGLESKSLIKNAVNEQIVKKWVENVNPNNLFEMKLCHFIIKNDVNGIYRIYHVGFFEKIKRKLIRMFLKGN